MIRLVLVAAKVEERLAISQQAADKLDVERFNLRKLSELEDGKQCRLRSQKSLQL